MSLHRWSELEQRGMTQSDVVAQLRTHQLERVRRGTYAPVLEGDALARHRRLVAATWRDLQPGAAVSHVSAAVLHGLPLPTVPLDRVWITRPGTSGKVAHLLHLCRGDLSPAELTEIDDTVVTGLGRTAVDVARRLGFADGVMVMDAALAAGADAGLIADIVRDEPRKRGNVQARMAAVFADGRSESPGESRSRVVMAQAGIPQPELQVDVRDAQGLIGRVDFLWRRERVIGEFDGRIKYSRGLAPGGDPAAALYDEKRREDRFRYDGWRVVRWGWQDLRVDVLGPLIMNALTRGRG